MCLLACVMDIFGKRNEFKLYFKMNIYLNISLQVLLHDKNHFCNRFCFECLGSLEFCDVKMGSQAKKGWEPLVYFFLFLCDATFKYHTKSNDFKYLAVLFLHEILYLNYIQMNVLVILHSFKNPEIQTNIHALKHYKEYNF